MKWENFDESCHCELGVKKIDIKCIEYNNVKILMDVKYAVSGYASIVYS